LSDLGGVNDLKGLTAREIAMRRPWMWRGDVRGEYTEEEDRRDREGSPVPVAGDTCKTVTFEVRD
jgi:hypothetical protein